MRHPARSRSRSWIHLLVVPTLGWASMGEALAEGNDVGCAARQALERSDPQMAPLLQALLQRIEALEAKVASLEGETRTEPVNGTSKTGMAVLAVDRQQRGRTRLASTQETDSDAAPEAGAAQQGTGAGPVTTREKSRRLPSRSWLETYGEREYGLQLHAFVDLEYLDAGPDGSRGGDATFDSHHANFFLTADLRNNLKAHTEFEFEHSGDSIEVDQAFLEWAPKDWLTLTAGRFYTPFGIERFVWYSPVNMLVSRPEPMRQIIPGNFYANGVMLSGNVATGQRSALTYEIAVSNGLGMDADSDRRGSRQNRDNNSDSAVSGRLAFSPNPWLEIGASYHEQAYDDPSIHELDFSGLDFAARWKGFELRSEYVRSQYDMICENELLGHDPHSRGEEDGWYGQLSYTFAALREWLPAWSLVTRYDEVDLDGSVVGGDDRRYLSLGLNTMVHDHFRIKTEYRFAEEKGPAKDDDTFLTQFVLDF